MPGDPFKKPARPKVRASVKRPQSPKAARRATAQRQMPGVASGRGLGAAASIRAAKTVGKPKSSGPKRMPAARQGVKLGTPGRHG